MGRKEDAESLGGAAEFGNDASDTQSCNKLHHFMRSAHHQPNHMRCHDLSVILGPQLEQSDPEARGRIIGNWVRSHLPIIHSRNHKG
jgi:hypothetical protein